MLTEWLKKGRKEMSWSLEVAVPDLCTLWLLHCFSIFNMGPGLVCSQAINQIIIPLEH